MSRVNMCIFFNSIHREREKKKRKEGENIHSRAGIYPYWSRNTYREGEGIERENETRQTQEREKENRS